MAILSLDQVSLAYGGQPLLDGVTLHIERGDRVCLLGANGAGKSSLLRVLAGETPPDAGAVVRQARLRVARLPQQAPTHLQGRVFDIVCPDHRLDEGGSRTLEARQAISRLHLDPEADYATLSGGTRRRVLLAQTLMGEPDIVLLDEPTNHLDLDSIAWLEGFLPRACRTFVFVTHDRSFLRRLASRIVELDRGRLCDWSCDYDTFLVRKEAALHAETREWERMDRRLEQEEAWRRRGVKARTVRNQGRLHALEALRAERRRRRERTGAVQMSIQESTRTGDIVIKTEGLTFGYGGAPLIRDVSTVIARGDRVGILGPNGCGKTTLLRLLLDPSGKAPDLAARSGRVVHGANLQVAYADQLRATLDEDGTLIDNIAKGQEFLTIQGVRRHAIGYMQDFLFTAEKARQPVRSLSGGERNRLLMARLFAQPSNVLVLDEPTNDLDIDTLELLEDQLNTYRGAVLLVSHDRTFLNRVVTSVLVFERRSLDAPDVWLGPGEGCFVNEYVGGYDDWAARRVTPPPPAPEVKAPPAPRPAPPPKKRRLPDKARRELDALPGHIEALEADLARLNAELADPAFYRQGGDAVAQTRARAATLSADLQTTYWRWEELESLVADA
jgi:ATP-binding cassette subfamily F protein uup